MGVHGLTSYLRDNSRILSTNVILRTTPSRDVIVPFVVDSWSFIYQIHNHSNIPWVYGGEYDEFCQVVASTVRTWLSLGLDLHFVFDGPYPLIKFSTATSRIEQNTIQNALLFFRTSHASRSTPRFLHETRVIPPLFYAACVHTLRSLASSSARLHLHFADEEGDPYAVELAGRLGGYVCGNDSDFVVLNTDGYAGYIPMDEMVWTGQPACTAAQSPPDEDSDFRPVTKRKGRQPAPESTTSTGVIPPPLTTALSLKLPVYTCAALASLLKIAVSLLPLLGALVGNDFTPRKDGQPHPFFEKNLSPTQRIGRVAAVLRDITGPSANPKQKPRAPRGAIEVINAAVSALLLRPALTSVGDKEALVERIVLATIQYDMPKAGAALWPTNYCALHVPTVCPLVQTFDSSSLHAPFVDHRDRILQLHIGAYRAGDLSPHLLDTLHTRSFWPRLFLESPDAESVARSIGRGPRLWAYAVLDDSVGLPTEEEYSDDEGLSGNSDEDELIDVVEEHSDESDGDGDETSGATTAYVGEGATAYVGESEDPIVNLRGALQKLTMGDTEPFTPPLQRPGSAHSPPQARKDLRPVTVQEYVRRGTRLVAEEVPVPTLRSLLGSAPIPDSEELPVALWSDSARFTLLLRALHSDHGLVRNVSHTMLGPVLALRWVLGELHRRVQAQGSKERERERWTRREARAFLSAFGPSDPEGTVHRDASDSSGGAWEEGYLSTGGKRQESGDAQGGITNPAVADRHVQLMAQALAGLESVQHLVESLLLVACVPCAVHRFSGRRFHAALGNKGGEGGSIQAEVWEACVDGLDDAFAQEQTKKMKKDRVEQQGGGKVQNLKGNGRQGAGGMFAALAGAEA